MAIPTEFKVENGSEYTLWNNQSGFTVPTIREPSGTQAVAVVWDGKEFKPVYFTQLQKDDEAAIPTDETGHRIAGKVKGADLFIISLPGKKVRDDLRTELTAWLAPKYPFVSDATNRQKKQIERSVAIGKLVKDAEDKIGKSAITVTAEAVEPPKTQPVQQPPTPQQQPTNIIPAAHEVSRRDTPAVQSYVSGQDFDTQDFGSQAPDELPYTGTLKRDFHPDKGFAFIQTDRNIPELQGGDAFVHISRVPEGMRLNGGDRVRFSLWNNGGKIQVDEVELFGTPRARMQRDPRSLPPIGEPDLHGEQFASSDDTQTERRGTVIIREIPIRTPFGKVMPGGAWRRIERDYDPN